MDIPYSARFSTLTADAAPPEVAGSFIALQTALGFLPAIAPIQAAPQLAAGVRWPVSG